MDSHSWSGCDSKLNNTACTRKSELRVCAPVVLLTSAIPALGKSGDLFKCNIFILISQKLKKKVIKEWHSVFCHQFSTGKYTLILTKKIFAYGPIETLNTKQVGIPIIQRYI
jgi:hypothetical protein